MHEETKDWTPADWKLYGDIISGKNGEKKKFSQAAIREVNRRRR